ncbi:T9SS type A sorting domain-containing protein [Candidatus Dependentiae bacterium]|nr:T9SS type A sorting domain-containing protein [Candidatus Dependentiae bacterium]
MRNKYLSLIIFISLLLFSSIIVSANTGNSGHTITIDGFQTDWDIDEKIETSSTYSTFPGSIYITWSSTSLTVGLDKFPLGDTPATDFSLFVAIDTDQTPASGAVLDGYGRVAFTNANFLPEYFYSFSGASGAYEWAEWGGAVWNWKGWLNHDSYGGYVGQTPEVFSEFNIWFSSLNNPANIAVYAWVTKETDADIQAAFPISNPTGTLPNFTTPYLFNGVDGSNSHQAPFLAGVLPTDLIITEVHYNPATWQGSDNDYEFVEFFNNTGGDIDLTGYYLGTLTANIPLTGTILANNYGVVAFDLDDSTESDGHYFNEFYFGLSTDIDLIDAEGTYFGCSNTRENIYLWSGETVANAIVFDCISYIDDWDTWGADGKGPSMEKLVYTTQNTNDDSLGGFNDLNWNTASPSYVCGTPGRKNSQPCDITSTPGWAAGNANLNVVDPGNDTTLDLTWDTATDTGNLTLWYNIYRSTITGFTPAAGNQIVTGVIPASYTDTGLTTGTTYYYRIQVFNCNETQSINTDEGSGTPIVSDIEAPVFAGIQSATDLVQYDRVKLGWNSANDTGGSTPITYNIYQSTVAAGQNFTTPNYTVVTSTKLKITGLVNNQTYYYVIRAEDSLGNEDTNSVELSVTPTGTQVAGAAHLLLSEIIVTPTAGEYIEIYNPTGSTITLSDYYVTDATYSSGGAYYYNIVTGADYGGGGFGDFNARFPDGATIAPLEYQTISIPGSDDFYTTFGSTPTYELFEDGAPDAIPDMREAVAGSINGQGGLTNSGEIVILYYWDGINDLVIDIDYAVWGDKDEAVDKTGIAIDSATDTDALTTTFEDDTLIANQEVLYTDDHEIGYSFSRIDMTEGTEIKWFSNGITKHDETSENLSVTWNRFYVPSPNLSVNSIWGNVVDIDTSTGQNNVDINFYQANDIVDMLDGAPYIGSARTDANGDYSYSNLTAGVTYTLIISVDQDGYSMSLFDLATDVYSKPAPNRIDGRLVDPVVPIAPVHYGSFNNGTPTFTWNQYTGNAITDPTLPAGPATANMYSIMIWDIVDGTIDQVVLDDITLNTTYTVIASSALVDGPYAYEVAVWDSNYAGLGDAVPFAWFDYHNVFYIAQNPPSVDAADIVASNQVDVTFSETVKVTTANSTTNYIVAPGNIVPTSAVRDSTNFDLVRLTFADDFTPNTYTLTVTDVTDQDDLPVQLSGQYTAQFVIEQPVTDDWPLNLDDLIVYPNPAKSATIVTFKNLTKEGEIKIYTIAGELVFTIKYDENDNGVVTWDIKNEDGTKISSGVYIYFADDSANGTTIVGKIAIIK